MLSTGRVRRVAPQLAILALIAAVAIVWVAVAGEETASALRRCFGWLDATLVAELVALLVVVALGARLIVVPTRLSDPLRVVGTQVSTRVSSIPAAVLLGAIVALAAVFRISLVAASHYPKVLGDELVYTGLAKGWAFEGRPHLRGASDVGHSTLYPLLIAPLLHVWPNAADALAATRVVDAVLMALTAVPAFLLARRVVPRGWALAVAALSVFAPWTAYAALTMTESLAYPIFVSFAALLVWTLEAPSVGRQAATVATLVALIGVRAQGLAVAAGLVAAIVVTGAVERELPRTLRRFAPTLGSVTLGLVLLVGARVADIAAPTSSYTVVFESLAQVGGMLEWGAWSIASFALALGVVALVALPVAIVRMLRPEAGVLARATGVVTASLTLAVLGSVALLSASPYGLETLHERSLFFVTPLVLTCFAHWLSQGLERPVVLSAVSAVTAVVLVALLPERIMLGSNSVDAPTAAFLQSLDLELASIPVRVSAVILALSGVATFLLVRRPPFALVTVVVAFAAVTPVADYPDELSAAQARSLAWVDRALPDGDNATLVYLGVPYGAESCAATAAAEQQDATIWTEFFNNHVRRIYHLYEANPRDGLASPELTVGKGGVVLSGDRPFAPDYAVIDSRQRIVGEVVARFDLASLRSPFLEGASLTLWKVEAPLRIYPRPEPLPPRGDGRGC